MTEQAICDRLSIRPEERVGRYAQAGIFNHRWDRTETVRCAGTIQAAEVIGLSGGLLDMPIDVTVNRLLFDYDQLILCGPVFPHEVVGMSGGNKYLFPGVSGPQVINNMHWLGALLTSRAIIGIKNTPVRALIDRAAACVNVPKLSFSFVVRAGGQDGLAGLYIGSPEEAWSHAADLAQSVHVTYVPRPYRRVLSIIPEMYDDLWTAAKGMYKVDPVIEDGGEVILYAPHITEFSYTHAPLIEELGFHVRDYFVQQWDHFQDKPGAVLAHLTHLRGGGTFENGVERPRIRVTLATGISRERCERVNLAYCDPATVHLADWAGREEEGILLVPHAGEMLYRLRGELSMLD